MINKQKSATLVMSQEIDAENEFVHRLVGVIGLIKDTIGELAIGQHRARSGATGIVKQQEIASVLDGLKFDSPQLESNQLQFITESINYYCAGLNGKRTEIKVYDHEMYCDDFSLAEINDLIEMRELRKVRLNESFKILIAGKRKLTVTGG